MDSFGPVHELLADERSMLGAMMRANVVVAKQGDVVGGEDGVIVTPGDHGEPLMGAGEGAGVKLGAGPAAEYR